MITLHRSKYRALRQMTKAINRGDIDAALKWSLIFKGQLVIAKRFSDLVQRRPRRKPRKPLPKPAAAPAKAAVAQAKAKPEQPPLKGDDFFDSPLASAGPTGPRTWREFYHPEPWMFEPGRPPAVILGQAAVKAGARQGKADV
jgi:hypothetical protein